MLTQLFMYRIHCEVCGFIYTSFQTEVPTECPNDPSHNVINIVIVEHQNKQIDGLMTFDFTTNLRRIQINEQLVWKKIINFPFPGTLKFNPSSIIILSSGYLTNTCYFRLFDCNNDIQIAHITWDVAKEDSYLSTLENLPEKSTRLQFQWKGWGRVLSVVMY